jgi:opacity protein-like surface antigen
MKRILCSTVAYAAIVVGSANAADLFRKAPISAEPEVVSLWSGFYVGGHIGAGWGTKEQTFFGNDVLVAVPAHTVDGALGGLQAGYNWQRGPLVFGIEADVSGSDISGFGLCSGFDQANCATRTDWIATVSGRVGWTVNRAMVYAKGGVAWANDRYDINLFRQAGTFISASETRSGWLFGAGVEYALSDRWSGKIEYNYIDLGTRSVFFANAALALIEDPNISIRQHLHLVKFGANYRFAGGLPIGPVSMPVKAPAHAPSLLPPFSAYNWTGFYVGGHLGAGWGTKGQSINIDAADGTVFDSSHSLNGILGGVQAGYNWQLGAIVLGVEADASATDLGGQGLCSIFGFNNCTTRTDWIATVTGRVGWSVDHALLYVKGGGAWARDRYVSNVARLPDTYTFADETRWGWTLGAGAEYAFAPNWSAKVEYNYLHLGTRNVFFADGANAFFDDLNVPIAQRLHLVKFGVNYRPNGAPLLADGPVTRAMPTKGPPIPTTQAPWNWAGLYLGGHLGAGWGTKEQTIVFDVADALAADSSHTVNGFLGGVQAGYNWQHGRLVFGLEADLSAADLKGQGLCLVFGFDNCTTRVGWVSTVTGRVGWTIDRALVYAKGGVAFVRDEYKIDEFGLPDTQVAASETRRGWVFGTGLEFALTPNWSAKVEYNYLDLGRENVFFANSEIAGFEDPNVQIRQRLHLVKVGANYRFSGAPWPIVTRY